MCSQPLLSQRAAPAEIFLFYFIYLFIYLYISYGHEHGTTLQTGSFPYEKLKCIALGMGALSADMLKT